MQEILIGAGVLTLIGGLALAQQYLRYDFFMGIGLGSIILGLLLGVPAGFIYHYKLWKALKDRIALPKNWWLFPGPLRERLDSREWGELEPWWTAGGLGFLLAIAGCLLTGIGLFL